MNRIVLPLHLVLCISEQYCILFLVSFVLRHLWPVPGEGTQSPDRPRTRQVASSPLIGLPQYLHTFLYLISHFPTATENSIRAPTKRMKAVKSLPFRRLCRNDNRCSECRLCIPLWFAITSRHHLGSGILGAYFYEGLPFLPAFSASHTTPKSSSCNASSCMRYAWPKFV